MSKFPREAEYQHMIGWADRWVKATRAKKPWEPPIPKRSIYTLNNQGLFVATPEFAQIARERRNWFAQNA